MFNINGGSFLVSRFSSSAVPLIVSDQTKGTVLLEMVEKNNTVHRNVTMSSYGYFVFQDPVGGFNVVNDICQSFYYDGPPT